MCNCSSCKETEQRKADILREQDTIRILWGQRAALYAIYLVGDEKIKKMAYEGLTKYEDFYNLRGQGKRSRRRSI